MALTDGMVVDGALSVGVGKALVVDGGTDLDTVAMAATGNGGTDIDTVAMAATGKTVMEGGA